MEDLLFYWICAIALVVIGLLGLVLPAIPARR
jgi:uncharacterized protein YqgC (DUF456 family)